MRNIKEKMRKMDRYRERKSERWIDNIERVK